MEAALVLSLMPNKTPIVGGYGGGGGGVHSAADYAFLSWGCTGPSTGMSLRRLSRGMII